MVLRMDIVELFFNADFRRCRDRLDWTNKNLWISTIYYFSLFL